MGKWISLFKKDIMLNRMYLLGWIFTIIIFNFMMYTLYPGEKGVQGMLGLVDQDIFQAVLGHLNSDAAPVLIWMSFVLPTMGIVIFIALAMYGNRTILLEMELGTHETLFTLPIGRTENLVVSFVSGQVITTAFNVILILPWVFPIDGKTVETNILINLFILNQLFFTLAYLFGIFFGILGGNLGKTQQITLIIILLFYSVQIIFRINESLQDYQDMNFIGWYNPNVVLFEDMLPSKEIQYILVASSILVLLNIWSYTKKEFERDMAMINFERISSFFSMAFQPLRTIFESLASSPVFRPLMKKGKLIKKAETNIPPKKSRSATSGIFVFWAKGLRKKLPYTADFLFSEARVLVIMFWVLVMFYPLQFFAYPGDETAQEIISGFSGGFANLITYGYDLTTKPYTWWLVAQAIGVHWFFMFPLVLHWGKKIVNYDKDRKIGDLTGALPISPSIIIAQRILAVFIELHLLYIQMAIYTVLSNQTFRYNSETPFYLAAIYGLIPLYLFLTLLLAIPIHSIRKKGVTSSRILGVALLLWFIVPYMTKTSVKPIETGLIGIYNPVKPIIDLSISEAFIQIIVLFGMTVPLIAYLVKKKKKMPFIDAY